MQPNHYDFAHPTTMNIHQPPAWLQVCAITKSVPYLLHHSQVAKTQGYDHPLVIWVFTMRNFHMINCGKKFRFTIAINPRQ